MPCADARLVLVLVLVLPGLVLLVVLLLLLCRLGRPVRASQRCGTR
jgi:hypothetical protein